jgi:hypothetical protein
MKFKRFLLVALLLTSFSVSAQTSPLSNGAGSKWKKMEKFTTGFKNVQELFVDPATIKKDGDVVSLVWLKNEDTEQGYGDNRYLSTVVEGAINCSTRKARVYTESFYKKHYGFDFISKLDDSSPQVKNLTEDERWKSVDEKINLSNNMIDRWPAQKRLFIEVCGAKSDAVEATSRGQKSGPPEAGLKYKKYPNDFALTCEDSRPSDKKIIIIYSPKNDMTWVGERSPREFFEKYAIIDPASYKKNEKSISFKSWMLTGSIQSIESEWMIYRSSLNTSNRFYSEFLKVFEQHFYKCEPLKNEDFIETINYFKEKNPPRPTTQRAPNKI